MKKAPNLKHQPRDKMTEVIIFAGSDAWAHAKQWQEQDGRLAGDNVPPVWLGEQQLAELDNLQIVPDGRYRVRLYQAGYCVRCLLIPSGRNWQRQVSGMLIIILKECTARNGRTGTNIWNVNGQSWRKRKR